MSLFRIFSEISRLPQATGRLFHTSAYLLSTREEHENIEQLENADDPLDRSEIISPETSMRYMESEAFKKTYGDDLVWALYKRNKTRHFLPDTRKTCIRKQKISTASPCPICRDKYLVLDYQNIKLLQQFISPYSGEILPTIKTGICQMQHQRLVVAVLKARDYGLLTFDVKPRMYNYEYYQKHLGGDIKAAVEGIE